MDVNEPSDPQADQGGLPALGQRPLYAQVEEILTRRIADGTWRPGQALPAEPEMAAELGVSQGTLRKALAGLERRNLIVRRQGRGTFVSAHTSEQARFTFFRAVDPTGRKMAAGSRVLSLLPGEARPDEARMLALPVGAPVLRLLRLRLLDNQPRLLERIVLPAAVFGDFHLPLGQALREEMYVLYQRDYGVTVARAEESLAATAADDEAVEHLGVEPGVPLLEIARLASDIAGRPVEWRVSVMDTRYYRYAVVLA